MRKRLLMIAAFALTMVGTVSAYNEGDYAYNSTQRFKITGENLVTNGNFANGRTGWYGATVEDPLDADTWDIVEGAGSNGETVVKSFAANAEKPMCNKWQITEAGTYIVSLDIKTPNAVNTTILAAGSAAGTNAVDFFLNNDGSFTKVASTEEAPVINVAASKYIPQEEWTSVVFYFTADVNQYLVMNVANLAAETQLTNIELHKANEVYDDRIAKNRIAWIKTLMEIPDFNVDAAKDAKTTLEGYIQTVEEALADGTLDDPSEAANYMEALENEGVEPFMSITSRRMNDKLPGTDNVATLAGVGRGGTLPAAFSGLELTGGNWGHISGEDFMKTAIQNGYANSGTYNVRNTLFPKGKYLFKAEIRNANTGKNSWPCDYTYNLETTCKVFVGTDTIETAPISGEQFQRVYHMAEIAEDGKFRAGVEWPGTSSGGAFFVGNVEVYALGDGEGITKKIDHIEAWNTFKAQYDAAASCRTTLSTMTRRNATDDTNYPWGQDSIADAKKQWDPYFNPVKAWVNENGEDTGIATTEELNEWAEHQGYYLPDTTETSTAEEKAHYKTYSKYAVVRGYDYTIKYVQNLNKPITDLGEAIEAAKKTRNIGANLTGDRDAYKTAILAALKTLKDIRITTTDATRVADSTTLDNALQTLNAATEAFLASVSNAPLVDIDFSNDFKLVKNEEEGTSIYVIEGAAGQIEFPEAGVDLEHGDGNGTLGYQWSLGFGEEYFDVIHMGSAAATINIPGDITTFDGLRITFDFWGGYLNKCYTKFDFQNAAGESLAQITRYNSQGTSSSTFGYSVDDLNKYITVKGSSKQNNTQIYTDSKNKTSFDIVFDYNAKTQKLSITNSGSGSKEGEAVALEAPESGDNKVAKIVFSSNYSSQKNSGRRNWLDNIKVYKSMSDAEEDITEETFAPTTGIKTVETVKANDGAIYNLAGQKVSKSFKGLIIKNGKKYFVK